MKFQGQDVPMAKKSFIPTFNRIAVFIVSEDTEDVSKGGIIMPDAQKGTWNCPRGIVIAVGPDCKQVKEGDIVLFYVEQGGKIVRHRGNTVVTCLETAILGVELPNDEGLNEEGLNPDLLAQSNREPAGKKKKRIVQG